MNGGLHIASVNHRSQLHSDSRRTHNRKHGILTCTAVGTFIIRHETMNDWSLLIERDHDRELLGSYRLARSCCRRHLCPAILDQHSGFESLGGSQIFSITYLVNGFGGVA